MHEALMVLSNNQFQKVTADRVQHQDFKRIFQCPECHATLTFRRSYTRNGHHVPAAFVHPRDGKPCEKRVEYNFSSTKQLSPFELIKRGQNSKKLERSFLRCLKYFVIRTQRFSANIPAMMNGAYTAAMTGRYLSLTDIIIFDDPFTEDWIKTDSSLRKKIEYNKGYGAIHKNPELLIEAVARALSSKKLDVYFNQEIDKVKESILSDPQKMNFFMNKKKSDWWKGFYGKIYAKNIDSLSFENLLDEHISHLKGLTRYLRQGISLEAKKKFFEILILGGLDFPVTRDIAWTQEQSNSYENRSSIFKEREEMIESFSLMSEDFLEDILANRNLNSAISDFDNGKRTVGGRFIRFFVSRQISLMKRYDWSVLPLFYENTHFSF